MIVVDASAAVELLLRTPRGEQVAARLEGEHAAAPELLDVEVISAMARLLRARAISEADAGSAVELLERMPLTRVRHEVLDQRSWQLRDRVRIAAAFYVACSELFRSPLLTCDPRLARAALPGTAMLLVK
ncbi:MAG: type II toxin-antitoxin system VapC family toxin [Micromonosporaceae bacterium]